MRVQMRLIVVLIQICLIQFIFAPSVANAVGFFVRPTFFEIKATRGESKLIEIDVLNKSADSEQILDIHVIALVQSTDGALKIFDPLGSPESLPKRSVECSSWISTTTPSVTLKALQSNKVPVRISVPANAVGTYLGGIVVQSRPQNSTGMGISLRFLIRFEIVVEGTSNMVSFSAAKTTITTRLNKGENLKSEFANVLLRNDGASPVNCTGSVSLLRQQGDVWRRIMTQEIKSIRSYPGTEFVFGTELPRRVPSGTYRLDYKLFANGKVIPVKREELVFVGDPVVGALVADAEINISSPLQVVKAGPKSKRTIKTVLTNEGDQPLNVEVSLGNVPELQGVSIGSRLGEEINTPSWFEVKNPKFTIRPHSHRPIVCTVSCPDSTILNPFYYSQLMVNATYLDGQKAGTVSTVLAVEIQNIPNEKKFQFTNIKLNQNDGNSARIILSSANSGYSHVLVKGIVHVYDIAKTRKYLTQDLEGPESWVLPFETPEFYGDLDLNKLNEGEYYLICKVNYDEQENTFEKVISVSIVNGNRIVKFH